MKIKSGINGFEWNAGNLDKSYLKHGITPKEAEEVFLHEGSLVITDLAHSQKEDRFIILGQTLEKKNLFVVFTIRGKKIRVISARKMHRKEVLKYEKIKKDTKI